MNLPAGSPEPAALLARVSEIEKEDFENIRLQTLAENELSSHHLVVIRKEEPLHIHKTHDVWAMVLQGEGSFRLREKTYGLRPGASFFVPRGTAHGARNGGEKPLAVFAILTPPFDGKDTVPVTEEKEPS